MAELKPMENNNITVSTIVDGTEKEKAILSDEKGYIAYRIRCV